DHRLQFLAEIGCRLRGTLDIRLAGGNVPVAAGHVLPDAQAELVGPVIPAGRLDLDVLAGHVEAELLGDLDIVAQSGVGRSSVQAIGPPTLIERAELEKRQIIEKQAVETVLATVHGDLAHAEIAGDLIDGLAIALELDLEIVKEGRIGGPKLGLVDFQVKVGANLAGDGGDYLVSVA